MNEKIRPTVLWCVFVRFLEELKTSKSPSEINWPLTICRKNKFLIISCLIFFSFEITSRLVSNESLSFFRWLGKHHDGMIWRDLFDKIFSQDFCTSSSMLQFCWRTSISKQITSVVFDLINNLVTKLFLLHIFIIIDQCALKCCHSCAQKYGTNSKYGMVLVCNFNFS